MPLNGLSGAMRICPGDDDACYTPLYISFCAIMQFAKPRRLTMIPSEWTNKRKTGQNTSNISRLSRERDCQLLPQVRFATSETIKANKFYRSILILHWLIAKPPEPILMG